MLKIKGAKLTRSRAYALQRHRPLSLQATITLPTEHDDPSDTQAHHLHGFIHLVNLFRPFDEQFVALWNKTRSDCSPSYLAALQKQLSDVLPTYLNTTENQTADLRTSQQWLRTMVWQLSMQNGYLSSGNDDLSMQFGYPVEIARDLVTMTQQFPQQSMEVHGIGLVVRPFLAPLPTQLTVPQIEKLFDVACSLTDVLSLIPANPQPFTLGPRDYLDQFMKLLSVLRNGENRFLPLLMSKVHEVLPTLANPMLQTVPDTPAGMQCQEIDIFEGFPPMLGLGPSVPSNSFHSMSNGSGSDFKYSNGVEFKLESSGMPFDRRIEELNSPVHASENHSPSPFTNPPIIPSSSSPMEFPGMGHDQYSNYPDLTARVISSNIGNYGEGVGGGGGGGQQNFKREFDGNMGLVPSSAGMGTRRPPLRQNSSSNYGMQHMPRSVPDYQLHRANSNGERVEIGSDLQFR